MTEVDLSQLMGGKSFVVHCTLSRNRYGVETTALADTRANDFALVDTKCATKLAEFLNIPVEPLPRPIPVKGYDSHKGNPIASILCAHLRIDSRRQYNVPFLVTDLGHHDVILGRKWLAYLNLLLDVWNRQLIWPATMPPTPTFVKEIKANLKTLMEIMPNPGYQRDAEHRDRALRKEIQANKI